MSNAFRITQRSVSNTMLSGLQGNLSRMQKFQEQLTTGKQVSRPSDSPVKTVEALQFRSSIRRTEQYLRNANDGLALLGAADEALSSGLDLTARIRELVLRGMDDTLNEQGREALAKEIDTLRGSLLDVANTRYLDRPVFGGNVATSAAYSLPDPSTSSPGGAYVGDTDQAVRTVGSGVQVAVTVAGTAVFGRDSDPDQLFVVLDELSQALQDGTASRHARLDGGLVNLDKAINRMISSLGELGARFNRVENVKSAAEGTLVNLSNSLAEVEDIDLPKTIVELQMQETAYKAALGATARVVQPSLLDFLR